MSLVFRSLCQRDVDAVYAFGIKEPAFCFESESAGFWSKGQLARWFRSKNDVCLGAFLDGTLVGFVLVAIHQPTGKATWENLFVAPEFRRSGMNVVRPLTDELRRVLKEKGVSRLHFLTDACTAKEHLRRYFRVLGYKGCGTFVWFSGTF